MKFIILTTSNTCNISSVLAESLTRRGHDARCVGELMEYITDDRVLNVKNYNPSQLTDLIRGADIVIADISDAKLTFPTFSQPSLNLIDVFQPAQKVFRYHHGTVLRINCDEINETALKHNITNLVSTPDLINYIDGGKWIPQIMPLDWDIYRFEPPEFDGKTIRISHSPTAREIKTTGIFMKSLREIQTIYDGVYEVVPEIIEHETLEKCLSRRRSCHIHYDQLLLGCYGISALEALAIGQLCIVGTRVASKYMGYVPFIDVCETDFTRALNQSINLLLDKESVSQKLRDDREWLELAHGRDAICELIEREAKSAPCYRRE